MSIWQVCMHTATINSLLVQPLGSPQKYNTVVQQFHVILIRYPIHTYHLFDASVCMGVASNEAEEAGASSLFCVRMHARIGDVL